MKKIFLILTFTCSLFILKAQTYSGFYYTWYEYGDGTFIKNSYPDEVGLLNFLNSRLPSSTAIGPPTGVCRITKGYNPPPPPTTTMVRGNSFQFTNTVSGYPTTTIPAGNQLFAHTSTPDILANDTLLVALNYVSKTPGMSDATRLLFFYNSNSAEAVFNPITNYSKKTVLPHVVGANTSTEAVPNIRQHFGETAGPVSTADFAAHGSGFTNGISFNLASASALPRNIFVSLFTNSVINSTDQQTFQLVLLDSLGKLVTPKTRTNIVNNARLKSHDPNYEIVEPTCLKLGQTAITQAKYKVHFQNTGLGDASYVLTTTHLPAGYTVADIADYNTFNWNLGGGSSSSVYNLNKSLNSPSSNKLILEFKHNVLLGTVLFGAMAPTVIDPANDVRTMGDFEFTLNLRTPSDGPTNLESYTAIIFDENDSVNTDKAVIRVRECCTCTESVNNNGNNNGNNPLNECKWCRKKKLSRWLRWLLCEKC